MIFKLLFYITCTTFWLSLIIVIADHDSTIGKIADKTWLPSLILCVIFYLISEVIAS